MKRGKKISLALAVGVVGAAGAALAGSEAGHATQRHRTDRALADLDMSSPGARRSAGDSLPASTGEIVVRLAAGPSIETVAKAAGAKVVRRSRVEAGWVLTPSKASLESTAESLRRQAGVVEVFINRRTPLKRRAFVPNDPYFAPNVPPGGPGDGWPGQFYFSSPDLENRDINILPAWEADLTGAGVRIGIVDDGFDTAHPDLAPNFDSTNSWDGLSNTTNPSPRKAEDNHGTFVVGAAAARGGNRIGITGAAPLVKWAGIRIPIGSQDMTTEIGVAAIEHRSSLLTVKNHSYGIDNPYTPEVAESNAMTRTALQGVIHVIAAGNDRGGGGQDIGKNQIASNPNVITVGAVNSERKFASYSSFGAPLTVTVFGGDEGAQQISTDRRGVGTGYSAQGDANFPDGTGNYAMSQGTSFTAPIVTGVMALGKQAKPNLTARWAKHLIARTAFKIDPSDSSPVGGWTKNAAGVNFNPNYGFGLLDVAAFIDRLNSTSGVSALQEFTVPTVRPNRTLTDNGETVFTFSTTATRPLEEVLLTLDIRHARRGQLEATLQSPRGTRTRLFLRSTSDTEPNIQWTFMANAFWGENPQGTWRLTVRDAQRGVQGTLASFGAKLRTGSLLAVNP